MPILSNKQSAPATAKTAPKTAPAKQVATGSKATPANTSTPPASPVAAPASTSTAVTASKTTSGKTDMGPPPSKKQRKEATPAGSKVSTATNTARSNKSSTKATTIVAQNMAPATPTTPGASAVPQEARPVTNPQQEGENEESETEEDTTDPFVDQDAIPDPRDAMVNAIVKKLDPRWNNLRQELTFTFRGVRVITQLANSDRTLMDEYKEWERLKNEQPRLGKSTANIVNNGNRKDAMLNFKKAKKMAMEAKVPANIVKDTYHSDIDNGFLTTNKGSNLAFSKPVDVTVTRGGDYELARAELAQNSVLLGQVYKEMDAIKGRKQSKSFATNGELRDVKRDLGKALAAREMGEAYENLIPTRAKLLALKYCDPAKRINPTVAANLSDLGRSSLLDSGVGTGTGTDPILTQLNNAVVNLQDREAERLAGGVATPDTQPGNKRKRIADAKEVTVASAVEESIAKLRSETTKAMEKMKAAFTKEKERISALDAKLDDIMTKLEQTSNHIRDNNVRNEMHYNLSAAKVTALEETVNNYINAARPSPFSANRPMAQSKGFFAQHMPFQGYQHATFGQPASFAGMPSGTPDRPQHQAASQEVPASNKNDTSGNEQGQSDEGAEAMDINDLQDDGQLDMDGF